MLYKNNGFEKSEMVNYNNSVPLLPSSSSLNHDARCGLPTPRSFAAAPVPFSMSPAFSTRHFCQDKIVVVRCGDTNPTRPSRFVRADAQAGLQCTMLPRQVAEFSMMDDGSPCTHSPQPQTNPSATTRSSRNAATRQRAASNFYSGFSGMDAMVDAGWSPEAVAFLSLQVPLPPEFRMVLMASRLQRWKWKWH